MIHKALFKIGPCYSLVSVAFSFVAMVLLSNPALGQEDLLDDRWFFAESAHFSVYSQLSSRRTSTLVGELELWRQAAALTIRDGEPFPAANVPNYVYLFSEADDIQHFTAGDETAFFSSTPRANFIAFVDGDDESRKNALHRYAHFLQKNFYDLRVPRWYEEGMAGYLSRITVNRGKPELERVNAQTHEIMAAINDELSMDRFLYRDEALASPRLIQIANLKSESLLQYLLHGYQEDEFADRREALAGYLGFLFEGRNQRFAFDQSFEVTTRQLDDEFERYLNESRRPRGDISIASLQEPAQVEPARAEVPALALMLGELALNSGGIEKAELFFNKLIESDQPVARAYSGLGDAIRFQSLSGRDQEVARYFELALEMAPDSPDILLDYGEYWESELQDCEKVYPQAQRQQLMEDIKQKFLRSVELREDSAESHLALAEFYLLEGQDWTLGRPYQRRAFELLPADGFIMEASVKYAIAAEEFDEAERLLAEMAQPLHFFGEPGYVSDMREQLMRKRRGEEFDRCSN